MTTLIISAGFNTETEVDLIAKLYLVSVESGFSIAKGKHREYTIQHDKVLNTYRTSDGRVVYQYDNFRKQMPEIFDMDDLFEVEYTVKPTYNLVIQCTESMEACRVWLDPNESCYKIITDANDHLIMLVSRKLHVNDGIMEIDTDLVNEMKRKGFEFYQITNEQPIDILF